jgi:hypothetical protein
MGTRLPWMDATLEQPRAIAIGADGRIGVVTEYGITVGIPPR